MRKIGVLFSKQEYADEFINTLCLKVDYFKKSIYSENVYKVELKESVLYVYACGIGQNNAIIGCSKLFHFYDCKEIISFDSCIWVYSKDKIDIGELIEFRQNIINYNFKEKPDFYQYDDCGVSDYPDDYKGQENLLLTSTEFVSSADVIDNLSLRWQKYDNLFYDSSAYGILAYCKANSIKNKIIRCVRGYTSENINNDVFEKLVNYI